MSASIFVVLFALVSISFCEEKCGKTLTADQGSFHSPNYPVKYPASSQCFWVIGTDAASHVTLTFESFRLERHKECRYDYVTIRDGGTRNDKLIGTFCGSKIPKEITSSRSKLFVEFRSDTTTHLPGFKASWKVKSEPTKPTTKPTKSSCGGGLSSETGMLTSPGYPLPAAERRICTWTVRVAKGAHVQVKFLDFRMADDPACGKGYVQLRDGTKGQSLGSFCGSDIPKPITSKSNVLTVGYLSDNLKSSRGFKAVWKTVYPEVTLPETKHDTPCGSQLTGRRGFVSRTSASTNCTWSVRVSSEMHVKVTLAELNMPDDPTCAVQEIEVKANAQGPTLQRICGNLMPKSYAVEGNSVVIKHNVFAKKPSASFKIYWQEMDPANRLKTINPGDCGITLAELGASREDSKHIPGTLPWVVAVVGAYGRVHCVGAVVAPSWVLTAAHCFQRLPWRFLWRVRAGEYDLTKRDGHEQSRDIRNIHMHHAYNPLTNDNDVALVELETPLEFNSRVKSVCLPLSDHPLPYGEKCTVAGWGARKYLRQPKGPLAHVEPTLVTNEKCNSQASYNGKVTSRMLCAGDVGTDSCQGDGGSPLTCVNSGRHYAVGVASWGNGCGKADKYGVYTDLRKFSEWVEQIVERN